jgi:Bacterial PH domain
MKEFKASLDTVSKIVTILMSPIFVLWPFYMFFTISQQPDHTFSQAFIAIIIFVLLIYVLCLISWVKSYTITDTELIINKFFGKRIIARADIKSAKYITKKEMGFVIRMLGNGGIFGYTGFFTNKTIGRMRWHVTNQQNLVILSMLNGKTICVSPDEVPEFLKAIN